MSSTIRVLALDGTWEALGQDRYTGIVPEGIRPTYNAKGPDSLTFNLRRDVESQHVDLMAFTPIEYLPGGDDPPWGGFIIDAPTSSGEDGGVTVNALGWQYHLDDDPYRQLYVHEDLTAWQDVRGRLEADLTTYTTPWVVDASNGVVTFGYQGPVPAAGGWTRGAVILDLGVPGAVGRIAIDWERSATAWTGTCTAYLSIHDTIADALLAANSITIVSLNSGGASGTFVYTPATPGRYALILADANALQDAARYFRIKGVRVARQASDLDASGNSTVNASDVVTDAAAHAPLLAADTSQITATSYPLRHVLAEDETPGTMIDRVNSYHGYRAGVDALRRVYFKAQPTRPLLAVDAKGAGVKWSDASAHSGRDIYNVCQVRGKSGSGSDLTIERRAAFIYPERVLNTGGLSAQNPGFEGPSATGWTGLTAVTTAGAARSGSAAGRLTLSASNRFGGPAYGNLTAGQVLKRGRTYRFDVWVKPVPVGGVIVPFAMYVVLRVGTTGALLASASTAYDVSKAGGYDRQSCYFTPQADTLTTGLTVGISFMSPFLAGPPAWPQMSVVYIDNVAVWESVATLPDRRGFDRTKILDVSVPTDLTAMAALGDAFLRQYGHTPFSGDLEVSADDAVRILPSEMPVPAYDLGRYVGELLELRGLVDPDTGDVDRVGQIAGVSEADGVASIAIDNTRTGFDALLARMGAV